MWYATSEASHVHKFPMVAPSVELGPWTAVRFHSREGRDRFVRDVETLERTDAEAHPMPDEDRAALVRWRPGNFLGLNDVAYAHGGRIVISLARRRARLA